jgi:hypothetical protein
VALLQGGGLPVTLNGPAAAPVSVDFVIEDSGRVLTNGVLAIAQGGASTLLTAPTIQLAGNPLLRARLGNPSGAQLGNPNSLYLVRVNVAPPPTNSTLIATGAVWRYRDVASESTTDLRAQQASGKTASRPLF